MHRQIFGRRSMAAILLLLASFMLPYGLPSGAHVAHASDEEVLQHCIVGPEKPMECFASEAEALSAATAGRIELAPGQTSRDLSDSQLFAPNPNGASLYAVLYEDADYGGSTLTIFSSSCSGWNNISGSWNDKASSVRTYSCGVTLYDNYNLSGMSLRVNAPGTNWVGPAMNDRASSWSLP